MLSKGFPALYKYFIYLCENLNFWDCFDFAGNIMCFFVCFLDKIGGKMSEYYARTKMIEYVVLEKL